MKPESELFTDVRNGVDGVEGSIDSRPWGAVDKEGREAFLSVLQDEFLEVKRTHPAPLVHLDLPAVVHPQAQGGSRASQGVVTLGIYTIICLSDCLFIDFNHWLYKVNFYGFVCSFSFSLSIFVLFDL